MAAHWAKITKIKGGSAVAEYETIIYQQPAPNAGVVDVLEPGPL